MINRLLGFLSHDIAIDLGTANTLVYVSGKGISIREPSVIARNKKTKEILSIGESAKKMLGRTPKTIEAVKPLKNGVIADFDATAAMLEHYIKKVHQGQTLIPKIPRPVIVIGVPSGVTQVEKRAVADAAISAGVRKAHLIEEPMAAAIGSNLDVENPKGKFIVDIGGGTTEIAMISLGGVVLGQSVRIAGDEMDEAIINYVRLKYSLLLGQPSAERVKISTGSAHLPSNYQTGKENKEQYAVIRGRDLETGLPKSIKLSSTEIREALSPIVEEILSHVKEILEEAPPELISDVMEQGIIMTGGGALLKGIDQKLSEITKMPVIIADDPLSAVVKGCAKVLENPSLLKKIKITSGLN